jgi:DNA-binding transcriptional ArsR family regulator
MTRAHLRYPGPVAQESTVDDAGGEPFRISDPRVLRAIAHPIRLRILDLFDDGPQRAADIATALDIPANQASFHLRQLAKYGLAVEAPEAARDRRDRVWKPVSRVINVDSETIRGMPGGEAALEVFREGWVGQAHLLVDRVSHGSAKETMSAARTGFRTLTKAEAQQFFEELDAVLERWKSRPVAPGARSYEVLLAIGPAVEP